MLRPDIKTHEICALLSAPFRLELVRRLRDGQRVTSMAEAMGTTQTALSHHLAVLRSAGLVIAERTGKEVLYRLNTAMIDGLIADLTQITLDTPHPKSKGVAGVVEAIGGKPSTPKKATPKPKEKAKPKVKPKAPKKAKDKAGPAVEVIDAGFEPKLSDADLILA